VRLPVASLVSATADTTLEGTSWTATGVNNLSGAVTTSALTSSLTAVFAADGVLPGFAGCNHHEAAYTTAGTDERSVSEISTTFRACDEARTTLERRTSPPSAPWRRSTCRARR
jgi:heat shock protein HslJ